MKTQFQHDAVLPYLRRYDALAFRHTMATDQGTDWKDHNNELEPLVEVYQGNRTNYEHEGPPKAAVAEKLYLQRSGYQPAGFLWNALAKGYRMGKKPCRRHAPAARLRRHRQHRAGLPRPGRRQGKEYLEGDALAARGRYVLTVNALGTGPIHRIDLIRNEQYVYAVTPAGQSTARFTYTDPHPVRGENRYYLRLQQEDGNLAWSSPVWVGVE